jgi:hypothetical protein
MKLVELLLNTEPEPAKRDKPWNRRSAPKAIELASISSPHQSLAGLQ